MEYTHTEYVPSCTNKIKYELSNCLKCNSDNIKLNEYDDHYGYISTAICVKCKNESRTYAKLHTVITEWNNSNNIDLIVLSKQDKIAKLKEEIIELKKLKKLRHKI